MPQGKFVSLDVPKAYADTLDYSVNASANDGYWQNSGGFDNSYSYDYAGTVGANWFKAFHVITGLSGLYGATINDAYIQWWSGAASDLQLKIYAEDSETPVVVTSAVDGEAKVLTTAVKDWDFTSAAGDWNTGNVTSIVQELATSYNPTSIQFIIVNDGSTVSQSFLSFDGGAAYGLKLHIDYTPSAAGLSVYTGAATSVEETSATLNGDILSVGDNATNRGFVWGTSTGVYSDSYNATGSFGTGAFNHSITVSPGIRYFAKAFAQDSEGVVYGDEVNFLTKPNPATNFTATSNTTTSVSFSWTAGSGADLYELQYSMLGYPSDNLSGVVGYWGSGTSCTIPNIASGNVVETKLFTYALDAGSYSVADTVSQIANGTDTRVAFYPYTKASFIGDSILQHGYDTEAVPNYFSTLTGIAYVNHGHSGYSTTNMSANYDTYIAADNPDLVIFEGGGNDVNVYGDTLSTFIANYTSMLDKAQASANITKILVLSPLPATGYTDGVQATLETFRSALTTLVSGYPKATLINASAYVGLHRDIGTANLYDIYATYDEDSVHYNIAGRQVIAEALSGGVPNAGIVAPTVTTQAVTNIEATSATGNGNITDTGGENATRRGFCYMEGMAGDPTTADSVVYDDGDFETGAFNKTLIVEAGKDYRVRAYAINSAGTGYGETVSLLTKPASPTGVTASNGSSTSNVSLSWNSVTGADTYDVWRDGAYLGTAGALTTYTDITADLPTITAGIAVASDGSSNVTISLSLSGTVVNNGTGHSYRVLATNSSGNSTLSSADVGYVGHGALTYQWQRSAGDSDDTYSNIVGATSSTYNDSSLPALSARYYKCILNATGATQATSLADRGYLVEYTPSTYSSGQIFAQSIIPIIAVTIIVVFAIGFFTGDITLAVLILLMIGIVVGISFLTGIISGLY